MTASSAADSACPYGWALPARNSLSDMLRIEYGNGFVANGKAPDAQIDMMLSTPISFTLNGYMDGGVVGYGGAGWYIRSYKGAPSAVGNLNFNANSGNVYTDGENAINILYSVRCIKKS